MSQFDKVYKELVETVLNKGTMSTGKVRTKYADGTPAHYISYIGYQFRLDNSTDEAHLITSRYAPYKSAIREIYWIAKLRSNNVDELIKLGSKFWNEWAQYVHNNTEMVYIRPRKVRSISVNRIRYVNSGIDIINKDAPVYSSNNYGEFYLLEKNNGVYKCQFVNTGFITYVKQPTFSERSIRDLYVRSVSDVGYYGEYKSEDILKYFGKHHKRWVQTWENMVRRCIQSYDCYNKHYSLTILGKDFECCENFLRWVMDNDRFGGTKLDTLQIDKDYYSSDGYSPETCVLLTPKENTDLTFSKWYHLDGKYFYSNRDLAKYLSDFRGLKNAIRADSRRDYRYDEDKLPLYVKSLIDSGELTTINPHESNSRGEYPRFSLNVNRSILKAYGYQLAKPMLGRPSQIDYVINELKNNPNSRRIITEIWNVDDSPEMALLPCAHLVQYNVIGNKLYMDVRQRSCDIALGLVANVFQYSVLHKLIAKECGLEPADLIWTISNAHIYDRHIEDLKKQIELPTLSGFKLDTSKVKSFNEWNNPDDITVPNYAQAVTNKISYEVAI